MAGATCIVCRFTASAMPHATRHTTLVTRHTSHITPHSSHTSQLESPMLRGMMFRMPGSGGLRGPSMPMHHMHHLGYPHGLQSMHEMQLQQVQPLLPPFLIVPTPPSAALRPAKCRIKPHPASYSHVAVGSHRSRSNPPCQGLAAALPSSLP